MDFNDLSILHPGISGSQAPVSGLKTVDCSPNPYDLRPALDAIEARIAEHHSTGPLVILIGENHLVPAHKMLVQTVMARLLKDHPASTLGYGIEWPYNYLEEILQQRMGQNIHPSLKGRISGSDEKGIHMTRVFRAASQHKYAPLSDRNLHAFCQDKKISVFAVDAANRNGNREWMDLDDPRTREFAGMYKGSGVSSIASESSTAVAMRNRVIANNIMQHIKDNEINIWVQSIGVGHVFGNNQRLKYQNSLSAILRQKGVSVAAVLPVRSERDIDRFDKAAHDDLRDSVILKGLSDKTFERPFIYGERPFLKKLSQNSGGEIEVMPHDNFIERAIMRQAIKKEIPEWIAKAEPV